MGSAGKKKTVTYNMESVNRLLTKNDLIVLGIHTQNELGVVQQDHSGIHTCLVHSCSWMILCLIHQMVSTYMCWCLLGQTHCAFPVRDSPDWPFPLGCMAAHAPGCGAHSQNFALFQSTAPPLPYAVFTRYVGLFG